MARASNRFWTLILALTLVAGGTVTWPAPLRADLAGGEIAPPPGPDPESGDPDWPDGKVAAPRPGPTRGVVGPSQYLDAPVRMGLAAKWMWSFRVALSTIFRTFHRS